MRRQKTKKTRKKNKMSATIEKISIKLGYQTEKTANEIARENNGRMKNWISAAASTNNFRGVRIQTHNLGRYSSRCAYTHYEYSPIITSWGKILAGGKTFAGRVQHRGFKLIAPKGYIFASDPLGVKIQSLDGKKDYHFSTDEIFNGGISGMMKILRINVARQMEQKKSAARAKRDAEIYAREIGSVRVTLSDSRRAGNCIEGSLQYAESRLHIPRSQILDADYLFSVPASKLLAVNGHEGVERAVRSAWMRETMVQI
jgi:hypothetical protein